MQLTVGFIMQSFRKIETAIPPMDQTSGPKEERRSVSFGATCFLCDSYSFWQHYYYFYVCLLRAEWQISQANWKDAASLTFWCCRVLRRIAVWFSEMIPVWGIACTLFLFTMSRKFSVTYHKFILEKNGLVYLFKGITKWFLLLHLNVM